MDPKELHASLLHREVSRRVAERFAAGPLAADKTRLTADTVSKLTAMAAEAERLRSARAERVRANLGEAGMAELQRFRRAYQEADYDTVVGLFEPLVAKIAAAEAEVDIEDANA